MCDCQCGRPPFDPDIFDQDDEDDIVVDLTEPLGTTRWLLGEF